MGLFASFFFVTLYLQQILRYSALDAGLAFLPWTLSVFGGSTLAPRLVQRFGLRAVLLAGMLTTSAGLLYFTGVNPGGSWPAQVLPGEILAGLGMGLSLVSGTVAAVQGVPQQQSGLASGLLNTSRLIGGALGLAILSTLAASQSHGGASAGAIAVTNGYSLAFTVGAGFTIAGALVAAALLRARPAPAEVAPLPERAREAEPLAA
jgi:MFS family permease